MVALCVWVCGVCACAPMLLMSSTATNDSIRLFLNALVTPMGHSARDSAHSAERAIDSGRGTWDIHTYTPFDSSRCTRAMHRQWIVCTHLFVCLLHLRRAPFVDSVTIRVECWRVLGKRITYSSKQTSIILRAVFCIEIWNMPLQCCWFQRWNIHAAAGADQIET